MRPILSLRGTAPKVKLGTKPSLNCPRTGINLRAMANFNTAMLSVDVQ